MFPPQTPPDPSSEVWSLALFAVVTIGTFAGMLLASFVLGERRSRPDALPYESGMAPTGGTHVKYAPNFYLVGLLFVVFDVEAAFLVGWAVAIREAGWSGLFDATFFSGVLLVSLVWLWRVGALDWASTSIATSTVGPLQPSSAPER